MRKKIQTRKFFIQLLITAALLSSASALANGVPKECSDEKKSIEESNSRFLPAPEDVNKKCTAKVTGYYTSQAKEAEANCLRSFERLRKLVDGYTQMAFNECVRLMRPSPDCSGQQCQEQSGNRQAEAAAKKKELAELKKQTQDTLSQYGMIAYRAISELRSYADKKGVGVPTPEEPAKVDPSETASKEPSKESGEGKGDAPEKDSVAADNKKDPSSITSRGDPYPDPTDNSKFNRAALADMYRILAGTLGMTNGYIKQKNNERKSDMASALILAQSALQSFQFAKSMGPLTETAQKNESSAQQLVKSIDPKYTLQLNVAATKNESSKGGIGAGEEIVAKKGTTTDFTPKAKAALNKKTQQSAITAKSQYPNGKKKGSLAPVKDTVQNGETAKFEKGLGGGDSYQNIKYVMPGKGYRSPASDKNKKSDAEGLMSAAHSTLKEAYSHQNDGSAYIGEPTAPLTEQQINLASDNIDTELLELGVTRADTQSALDEDSPQSAGIMPPESKSLFYRVKSYLIIHQKRLQKET